MFFEALSIGCRKTKYDVTKVTHNMYSSDTCCMSRERMEMDGRDSAKCRKSKLRDMIGTIGFVNDNRTKKPIVSSSPFIQKTKNVKWKTDLQWLSFLIF